MSKPSPISRRRAISLLVGIGLPVLFLVVLSALLLSPVMLLPDLLVIIVVLGILKKRCPAFFAALGRRSSDASSVVKLDHGPIEHKPSKRTYVVLVPLNAVNRDKITINDSPFVIGRSPDANYRIDYEQVSRRHLTIEYLQEEKLCYVTDSSTNGTFLNSERLVPGRKVPLHQGDALQIAEIIFSVEYVHY